MSRLVSLIELLSVTRSYTNDLLDHVRTEDWFWQPSEGVTHIAWQVGHLARVEYALCLRRVRGEEPDDAELISDDFATLFGKGSVPMADPEPYPEPDEIRAVLDRVHQQTLKELSGLPDTALDESSGNPHPMFKTKYEAIRFCAQHEMIHVGQIALLRRLLGYEALR